MPSDAYVQVKPSSSPTKGKTMPESATTYGACGVEGCTDCLPLFDEDDNPLPESP